MFCVEPYSTVSSSFSLPDYLCSAPSIRSLVFTRCCRPVQLGKTFPAEKKQGRNPPVSMSCTLEEQQQVPYE